MGRRSKDVTLTDVAHEAGVAVGTASKALSGAPHVRQETRDRVVGAAERLGYLSHTASRTARTGRTYTVGLITSDSEGRFTLPVILGAERSLAAGRMAILFCDARDDPVREAHWIRTLQARSVDGFIVTSHRSDPRPSLTSQVDVPMVYAYSPSEDESDVSVVPDDRQGGYLAAKHLLEGGRRRLAYVGGPSSYEASHLRRAGFMDALAEAGVQPATDALFVPWQERAGRQAARSFLHRGAELDGVFCASDQIARGFSEELQRQGRSVPGETAVVGFDDWHVMTQATDPRLTSVSMHLDRVGEIAAMRLLELISGGAVTTGREHVAPELIVHESST